MMGLRTRFSVSTRGAFVRGAPILKNGQCCAVPNRIKPGPIRPRALTIKFLPQTSRDSYCTCIPQMVGRVVDLNGAGASSTNE